MKKAWILAFREFWHRHQFKSLDSLEEPSLEAVTKFFFREIRFDSSRALKKFAWRVKLAAQDGDVEFFKRVVSEMRNAARNKPMNTVEGEIMGRWIACCLWLASDFAASTFLQQVTGRTVTETAYCKARQRLEKLGLVGYIVAHKDPLIVGCTKQRSFTFREGWTNLVPKLSR